MSMHNKSEASFERINKSMPDTGTKEVDETKSKKRCVIIILIVCILAAAITALILVLVFKGSSGTVPKGYNGYTLQGQQDGLWYFEGLLRRTEPVTFPVPIDDETNPEFKDLRLRVSMMNDHTFRIRLNPVNTASNSLEDATDIKRWEVPDSLLGNTRDDFGMRLTWGNFAYHPSPAGIELSNPMSSGIKYISTVNRNLVFSDKFLEMGFLLDSRNIFGFGERQRTFGLTPGNYSSWANGRDNNFDPGELGHNSYGDHPFVLARLKDNSFVGIFFKNSNAKSLEYTHVGDGKSVLNFRAIGGILDFFVMAAENPEDVIKAYHQVIGVPYLPPFWSLGFQQSSWQYNDTARVTSVLEGYDNADMPLEAIWLDIEYMYAYRNFEVNQTRFPNLPQLTAALHQKNQKLITIVDAGFAANDSYSYYRQADEQGLFIKSVQHPKEFNGNLIGYVWPGKSAFIDFLHPKSTPFWVNALVGQHESTKMDGIWIDMNEATTLCDGECPFRNNTEIKDSNSSLPFNPLGEYPLEGYSLSLDGQHYYNNPKDKVLNTEYNMHSLYAIMQAKATYSFWFDAAPLQGKRPFVLSRSSFAGAGKYTSHWLGDNWSDWSFMQFSIAGIMDFNMFGIPLVGADVCGFHGRFEDEMCGRWTQLSVFYPFARNHYNLTDYGKGFLPEQEPYNLKSPYKEMARAAIIQRYSYLRYFYTRLFEISKRGGGTLVRPLFFEFPEDDGAYDAYEHTFMVGSALKVSPVLRPKSEHNGKIQSYFPGYTSFISLNDFNSTVYMKTGGKNVTLDVSDEYTIVHMKEGSIIPFQNATKAHYFNRTAELFKAGITLLVYPDTNSLAQGSLYIDENGDDQNDLQLGHYQYYGIRFGNNTLSIDLLDGTGAKGDQTTGNQVLDEVVLLGAKDWESGAVNACVFDNFLVPRKASAVFDATIKAVRIKANSGDKLLFKDVQAIQLYSDEKDSTFCTPKYTVKGVTKVYKNENVKAAHKLVVDIGASGSSTLLPPLQATFTLVNDNIIRIEIADPSDKDAFKAPKETFDPNFLNNTDEPTIDITSVLSLPKAGEDFYYEIHQFNAANKVYYSTKGQSFVYSRYYKKTTAVINSSGKIFGLGERVGDFFLDEGVYTLWNRDEPSPIENGKRPGNNIYGTHPVYFTQTTDPTFFFGVFDHNVGAQDYIIRKLDAQRYEITQIKTTGVTDQFIILRTGVQQVIANFNKMIGLPVMVPEWSLGWHQCRYGYNSTQDVVDVVNGYLANNIPLDVMWTDIDYMEMYRDFTLSTTRFYDLPDKIKEWREKDIRYVPILDAAVAYEPENKTSSYARGSAKDVFIKDPNNPKKPFLGVVWPGPAVYLDWLKDNAEQYWVDEMKGLHKILPFDGMWIDMNEASNFCNGYCTRSQRVENSLAERIFYTPGSRDLNTKSIIIDAKHADGSTEFDAHSTYGFYMSKATSNYFSQNKLRPFVITRSTYSGVGKFASHWLGDNFSNYDMLKYSVGGVFLFNMFGVPVVGADICGFIGDTNPDLCARWYALGAFYPFARNHNDKNSIAQEPFVSMFKERTISGSKDVTYTDFIREASLKRYALHRYQYSNIHKSSVDGTPYFTPLFYKYSDDPEAYKRVEHNIMLGDSVKISPMVDSGTAVTFYFPEKGAQWCPIWPKYQKKCFLGQSSQAVLIPHDEIFAHLKSGSIIPLQLGDLSAVQENINLEELKSAPTDLAILADSKYKAQGWARFDDGETLDLNAYTEFHFDAAGVIPWLSSAYMDITITTVKDDSTTKDTRNQNIGNVVIYQASQFKFTGSSRAQFTLKSGDKFELSATYNKDDDIVRFLQKDGSEVNLRDIKSIHITA